jgi:hypothetical protein
MNAEIIKAMNKKEKKHPIRKWWNKNGYKVMRVIFFPIWATIVIKNKIKKWLDNREVWSEERVNEILNYYVPRRAEWDNEDKIFYFFDNGYGWSMSFAKKYLKRKDRRFWEVWHGWCGGEIRLYLINHFELAGFKKEVGNCSDGWTEVSFTMIEEN